jgi:outer membrane protein OmpA-like peptidoglycan-associated protein
LRKLRTQLAGTGVDVQRMGDNITLNMPGNVTFAADSADLNAQFFRVLDEVAGHTDSAGSDACNQQLSERRAASVIAYMASHGVQRKRMIRVRAGEKHPSPRTRRPAVAS